MAPEDEAGQVLSTGIRSRPATSWPGETPFSIIVFLGGTRRPTAFATLFEDDDVLVLDKPLAVAVLPGGLFLETPSCISSAGASARLLSAPPAGAAAPPGPSCFARNRSAARARWSTAIVLRGASSKSTWPWLLGPDAGRVHRRRAHRPRPHTSRPRSTPSAPTDDLR